MTRIAEDGSVQPALARDWTASADGLRYRFRLRPGVRFHDGTAFRRATSSSRFGIRARTWSTNPFAATAALQAIEGRGRAHRAIELRAPVAEILTWLGWGNLVIVSPASPLRMRRGGWNRDVRFSAVAQGIRGRARAQRDYWGTPAPLAAVTFRVVPDPSGALAALLAGDVDGYANFPAPENLDQLAHDARYTVASARPKARRWSRSTTRATRSMTCACGARWRTRSTGARSSGPRCTAMRADRQATTRPHAPGYVDLTGRILRPGEGAQPVAAAGYPQGFALRQNCRRVIRTPQRRDRRRQLAAVGIRARIENVEWAQWLEQVFKNRDYDLTIVSQHRADGLRHLRAPRLLLRLRKSGLQQLLGAAARTGDGAHRNDLLAALQPQARGRRRQRVPCSSCRSSASGAATCTDCGARLRCRASTSAGLARGAPRPPPGGPARRVPAALAARSPRSPHSLRSWRCGVTSECPTCSPRRLIARDAARRRRS